MPNLLQTLLADDGAEIVADLGHNVIWSGNNYAALVGEPDVSVSLETGGFVADGEFTIKILRAAFALGAGPFPQNGDVLTYDAKNYVITRQRQKADSPFIQLDIETTA